MAAAEVSAPRSGFWRVARAPDPLKPTTPIDFSADSGTFGNRFDSPVGGFSVLYFGTSLEACFMETLARLRPAPGLREIIKDEWHDKHFMEVGAIAADWRHRRLAVKVSPPPRAVFLDVEHPDTIQHLREELADTLALYGYRDLDVGIIRGPDRKVTRAISYWAFEQVDEVEAPLYAGIRYFSRQGTDFECWAVFADVPLTEREKRPITLDMPALRKVAKTYDLVIH